MTGFNELGCFKVFDNKTPKYTKREFEYAMFMMYSLGVRMSAFNVEDKEVEDQYIESRDVVKKNIVLARKLNEPIEPRKNSM